MIYKVGLYKAILHLFFSPFRLTNVISLPNSIHLNNFIFCLVEFIYQIFQVLSGMTL